MATENNNEDSNEDSKVANKVANRIALMQAKLSEKRQQVAIEREKRIVEKLQSGYKSSVYNLSRELGIGNDTLVKILRTWREYPPGDEATEFYRKLAQDYDARKEYFVIRDMDKFQAAVKRRTAKLRANVQRRWRAKRVKLAVQFSEARISPAKLAESRKQIGISQEEFARRIGCSNRDLVRRWEKGETNISGNYFLRWMLVTNTVPADFID